MGPLILGSFGFTQHVLFNERSAGLWFAALPHAPNSHALLAPHDLRGDLDFAGVLERRTPSVSLSTTQSSLKHRYIFEHTHTRTLQVALCSDEGRSEPSAIAGHYNDLAGGACTPGRVSLRTLSRERAALATELGSWAQASLRIKADGFSFQARVFCSHLCVERLFSRTQRGFLQVLPEEEPPRQRRRAVQFSCFYQ